VSELTFDEYQTRTGETAIYPGQGSVEGLYYVGLGLGEAGEVQGKIKKVMRDHGGVVTDETRKAIKKELGDAMWYIARTASELELTLSEVAQGNLDKLGDRKDRGVLTGNGDDR